MSEVNKLAADLAGSAAAAERASSVALTVVAAKFASAARAAAPIDTGALRSSIVVSGDGDERIIAATDEAASFVEFGTSDTAPQPFMWPQVPAATRALAKALGAIDPLD